MATAAATRTAISTRVAGSKRIERRVLRVYAAAEGSNFRVETRKPGFLTSSLPGVSLAVIGASAAVASQADAAQQVMDVAGDNRLGSILFLLAPALGWVLFNILGPFQNQLKNMQDKKAMAAGLGLSAAALLALPETADAAQQVMDVAGDNRLGSILFLLAPALGWVLFNILGPFQNQLKNMQDK